jgi:hypothetical protein
MKLTLWLIHVFETKKPSAIIKILNEYQKKKIVVNVSGAKEKISDPI